MARAIRQLTSLPVSTTDGSVDGIRAHWLFVGLWAASMVSLPIFLWTFGEGSIPQSVSLSVILLAIANLFWLHDAWGARRTALVVAAVVALAWLVEFVGSKLGIPFGAYHYTELLTPQIGHVPLIIPLAWLMMLPAAWSVSAAITRRTNGLAFIVVSAAAFTAWDLYLDPQMVGWGFWVWDEPGLYFGIPIVNFLGWFAAAGLITLLVKPAPLPQVPGLAIYSITWFLQFVGLLVFWQMPGPALFGGVAMGAFMIFAWRRRLPTDAVGAHSRSQA